MNSAMRPIFNEKVTGKRGLWVPWKVHGTHWCALSTAYFAGVNTALTDKIKKKHFSQQQQQQQQPKKKKAKTLDVEVFIHIQIDICSIKHK